MQVDDDFLNQWELILADVNKTDVPLECIKKVVVKLAGNRQKTFNIYTLIKHGLQLEDVESLLTRFFAEHELEIKDVDFVVDIKAVASLVQPETDKLLGKL